MQVHRSRRSIRVAMLLVAGTVAGGCMTVTPPPATPLVVTGAVESAAPSIGPGAPTQAPTVAPTLPTASPTQAVASSIVPGTTPSPSPVAASLDPTRVPPELAARLDATIAAWRDAARVPGVVAALRMPDGTIWTGAVGRAVVGEGGARARPSTPWVIGSITKTFVAALAFQLQEEGVLSLDSSLSTWLPEYPNGSAITLRMLLNHTSGIADYFWHPDYASLVFGRPTHHWTVDEVLALAAERAPVFQPGRDQQYSNTNYILAGRILEIAGGAPLAQQLRARFLDPLGLTSAVFQGDEPVPDGAAKGYWRDAGWVDWSDGTTLRPTTSAATVVWAAGAMLVSAEDLLTWENALYSGQILSPESLAQLLTFAPVYGPGTRAQRLAGWDGYGHGGSLRGFNAAMYRMPEVDVDVIVMTNRGDLTMDLTLLAADLVKQAVGRKPGTGPVETPIPLPVASASAVPAS